MSPQIDHWENLYGGFPRVSGDEPAFSALPAPVQQFSPRERG